MNSVNYWASGEVLSDCIGPYLSDPTNNPTGSGGSGGYTYSYDTRDDPLKQFA